MRSLERGGWIVAAVAFATSFAMAEPNKPKLWVQVPGPSGTDAAMLQDLAGTDARVRPIIRINVPNIGQSPCASNTLDPSDAGCAAATFAQAITLNRPLDPSDGMFHLGIMIAGFGQGGREPGFYFPAPAIAKPRDQDGNHDAIGGPFEYWNTPWFNEGPAECAQWLYAFGEAYSDAMTRFSNPGSVPDGNPHVYQPRRLIFDLEAEASSCCDDRVFSISIPNMVGDSFGGIPQDPRFVAQPVWGTVLQDPFHGVFTGSVDQGATLDQLYNACPDCSGPVGARLWLVNVNLQARNAAFDHAVRSRFVAGPSGVQSGSDGFSLGSRPLYSNFGWFSTDAWRDASTPPYDIKGNSLFRYSYNDEGNHYQAYHNYADFHSPVSYGFLDGYTLLPGQTRSDWVVQATREALDSLLFTPGVMDTARGEGPPGFITPWIAGINQYFVNGDHHRRLLALLRAKYCDEFNLFINRDAAMHDRTMDNWSKFRHIVDQVFGFDLDPVLSTVSKGTLGQTNNAMDELTFSDYAFVDVASVPNLVGDLGDADGLIAEIQPVFRAYDAPGRRDPATPSTGELDYDRNSIRESANIRLNVEIVFERPPPIGGNNPPQPPVQLVPPPPPEFSAAILNHTTGQFVNVPLTAVCQPATSPGKGVRYVLSGMMANTNRRFVSNDDTLKARVTVQAGWGEFIAHYDLVQVVGVDAGESDLDWNHDGKATEQDLLDFFEDWKALWLTYGNLPTGRERWSHDMNNDGVIESQDPCTFESLLDGAGVAISAPTRSWFREQLRGVTGQSCD